MHAGRVAVFGVFAALMATVGMGAVGDGVKLGAFRAHPYVDSVLSYDSNVFRDANDEEEDVSFIVTPGIRLNQMGPTVISEIEAWVRAERYTDFDERDHDDFGERVGLTLWDRDRVQMKIVESFKTTEEYDESTGEVEERDLLDVSLVLGRDLTDKTGLDVGVSHDFTDYASPNLFGWDETVASAELGCELTDKSIGTLTAKVGQQTSDGSEDGDLATVLLGLKSRLTSKVQGRAGLGWYGYEGGAADISMLGYNAMFGWQVAPKVIINGSANNGVEPATQDSDNVRKVTRISLGSTWRPTRTLAGTLSGWYVENDYELPVSEQGRMVEKNDETLSLSLRVDYKSPNQFLGLFGETRVESRTASIDAYEYDQVVGQVGLTLLY